MLSVVWFQNVELAALNYGCPVPTWNRYDSDKRRYYWNWVTTETTWDPVKKVMSVRQNGTFVNSMKIDNPDFSGNWVGLHGFCGYYFAEHCVRDFRLTIHNNPNASPVGPYPTGPALTASAMPTNPLATYSSETDTVTMNLKKPYWHFLKKIT
jgi:hypothetical protein